MERTLTEVNPCLIRQVDEAITTDGISRVDLLFVVDDSISMEAEQGLLRQQFPRMVELLTTGQRPNGETFEPIKDLHIGVVSTNLGAPTSVPIKGCAVPGDDGLLLVDPNRDGSPDLECPALSLPQPFIAYKRGDDPHEVARAFACMATLGTSGCGFEQPLEAMLKAVMPAPGSVAIEVPDVLFHGAGPTLEPGHGGGENAGFIRGLDGSEDSIIAVVVVTDEEDCSARDQSFFTADGKTSNVVCTRAAEDGSLYGIERYVMGLRALRPSHPERVIFAAIVGLPDQQRDARDRVDFESGRQRDDYYAGLLGSLSPEIVEKTDGTGVLSVQPICDNGEFGDAAPAPRIVQVAQAFGENGLVHSICTRDFRPALDSVVERIADNLPDVCLTFPLVPNASGRVEACSVKWELPSSPKPGELARCSERAFLRPATEEDGGRRTKDGRAVCVVDQVPVFAGHLASGQGWYYDDFSDTTVRNCPAERARRVAFTDPPGPGVNVTMSCSQETVSAALLGRDHREDEPTIGSACLDAQGRADSALCVMARPDGAQDTRLRCHPDKNVCFLPCIADADCPAAWVCDDRDIPENAASGPQCRNPTCGG